MSNNDSGGSTSKTSKLGRKGDPRMHRAVSARLSNPEISLFDALRVGGFDYPTNDDASVMDSEKVTLGQRKNQLSRRLRLAKKGDGMESGNLLGKIQGRLSSGGGKGAQGGRKSNKGLKEGNNLGARALQMKNDHPDLGIPDYENDLEANMDMNGETPQKRQRIAKFHPDYAPLFVPPPSARGSNQGSKSSNANSNSPYNSQQGSNTFNPGAAGMPGMSGFNPSAPYNATLFTQQIGNVFNAQQSQQPRASAVAVSSLSSTAQTLGMTLEQLAMTLASNPSHLAKMVSESNAGGEKIQKKHEMALHLHETECRSMYSKCMLMAGMDPRICQPGTSGYLQFALKAWQAEGKRLHDMMGGMRNLEPPMDAATGAAKSAASASGDSDGHNHSHSHSHSHNHNNDDDDKRGGQHIHRLDGQCGHKAIIHQPKGGHAHIDFVIGDKVECYKDIEPVGKSFDSIWPSKYKCADYDFSCSCSKNNNNSDRSLYEEVEKLSGGDEPKIIPLSEINLQDPEWNYDVNGSIDGGVMGLFKLGERQDDAMSTI